MSDGIVGGLILVSALGSGVVGGVFFGFSSFVMAALARLPPAPGIAAMQSINLVVINPAFLGVFLGTAATSAALMLVALATWGEPRAPWLLAGGVLYLFGTLGVTAAFNVPRNNALAPLDPGSAEAAAFWPRYVASWTAWNHGRTAAAALAAICFMIALR